MSRGKTWPTIFRPGEPTTSPMNRILRGMRGSIPAEGAASASRARPGPARLGSAWLGSPGEFYGAGLAQHSDLDLAGVDQLFLDGAGDVAAELGGVVVAELVAIGD